MSGPNATWHAAPPKAKSKREILRCLKRYIAREVYRDIKAAIAT
jgi:hypothetical protein